MLARPFLAILILAAIALPACGGGGDSVDFTPPTSSVTVTGTVVYERLTLTTAGLGLPLITRPARFIDVQLRVVGGAAITTARTSATGDYTLTGAAPVGSNLEIVAYAQTGLDPQRDITAHEADPPATDSHLSSTVFRHASAPFANSPAVVADLTVPYGGGTMQRPSIGFAALDVCITCWDELLLAGASNLPDLHIYTRLGNNLSLGSSFYRSETRSLALLGGASGALDTTDTDYFDDPVVAHEFQHYMERELGYTMSRGGQHGPAEDLELPLAFSEGMASAMGCLAIGSRDYIDSVGTGGALAGGWDNENITGNQLGVGGELVTTELIWDLVDGGLGPADADGDGLSVPLTRVYVALLGFVPDQDAPYLHLLLDRLVADAQAGVTQGQMTTLMTSPENHLVSYPAAGNDVFPTALAIPGNASGTLDSLPAANKNPSRGRSSSDWYRFTLGAQTTVTINLAITPIAGSGDNLELFLCNNRDVRAPIGFSINPGAAAEQIGPVSLPAGTYIVRIEAEATGNGNRASYNLTTTGI